MSGFQTVAGTGDEQGKIIVDAKAWPALEPGTHGGDMSNIVP
jgi:hypothetical protein